MGRVVLILGGARSGKSTMAERMAREMGGRVTYLATAQPLDEEMRQRIENHRSSRPQEWRTVEEPLELANAVAKAAADSDVLLVDCLTLWISNQLCRIEAPESTPEWHAALEDLAVQLEGSVAQLLEGVRSSEATALVVSNEVGLGLVPPTPLGRAYRDLLGMVNRRIAAEAEQVLLMVAGLAVDMKRLATRQL